MHGSHLLFALLVAFCTGYLVATVLGYRDLIRARRWYKAKAKRREEAWRGNAIALAGFLKPVMLLVAKSDEDDGVVYWAPSLGHDIGTALEEHDALLKEDLEEA